MMKTTKTMNLMELPTEMIEYILSFMSFEQCAKLRAVNTQFNTLCSEKLNKGFTLVEKFHNKCIKAVKNKLPRRESERKHHPLSRHSDILMAVETRLSMLSMTFVKYMDGKYCCFIPGKVLDEAMKVLRIVNDSTTITPPLTQYQILPRPHDFLQEYRDISSMAMEHFDEKIVPAIREKMKNEKSGPFCRKDEIDKADALRIVGLTSRMRGMVSGTQSSFYMTPDNSVEQVFMTFRKSKTNCTKAHKLIVTLHQNLLALTKKTKQQNIKLKQKLYQQRLLVKHLRYDVNVARSLMYGMRRDINKLKNGQLPNQDQNDTNKSKLDNLTVDVTSCISIPGKEPSTSQSIIDSNETDRLSVTNEVSSTAAGIKRKRESTDENVDDKCV